MSERQTRSRTGVTPRKPSNPGFVETPGRRGRPRKSLLSRNVYSASLDDDDTYGKEEERPTKHETIKLSEPIDNQSGRDSQEDVKPHANGHVNGYANGHINSTSTSNGTVKAPNGKSTASAEGKGAPQDSKIDTRGEFEFGGSFGVGAIMIGFPVLMWYMWLGATYYDGLPPTPAPGESWSGFAHRLVNQVYEGAFPHAKAWAIYWSFIIFEGACYLLLPGVYAKGKPLEHLGGKQLEYYCSGVWSFYVSIAVAAVLHFSGVFPLYTLLDEFGPLLSVAIISGCLLSIVAYVSALARGAQHRMTGYLVYDFFMGAELNPRLFGWLDFKMFFEVRLPWFILFFLTSSAAARQYEQYGYVSGEVGFMLMAHFLYANACCKGEELIVTTWDMYYEKWGFMLIFWNLAGVPLSYCHSTIYLANHPPSTYAWPKPFLIALYISYLFVYWVWDTCNSQKNVFRARERGSAVTRKTFPQLPWKEIKDPEVIRTSGGETILCDGWYGKARKVHYACDFYFAMTWGLITGFKSPFPWFYPVFFAAMITHRAWRDIAKCRKRYGEAWTEYERRVPYLFIPYVI